MFKCFHNIKIHIQKVVDTALEFFWLKNNVFNLHFSPVNDFWILGVKWDVWPKLRNLGFLFLIFALFKMNAHI